MRNRRSTITASAAAAVLMLALTACGNDKPAEAPGESLSPSPAASAPASSPAPSASPEAGNEAAVLSGTGTYSGQIDNHSVEIVTEDGPTSFELGTGTESAPESLESGQAVQFKYTEQAVEGDSGVSQRILSELKPAGQAAAGSGSASGNLAPAKELKLELEGNAESKQAQLAEGDGYSLYVFDIFTFDPSAGRLTLKADSMYTAEVVKLPADYNLDQLELEGKEELKKSGEAVKMEAGDRPEAMKDAELYLRAQGMGSTREYIVKELDGQGYIFKLDIPNGEPAEGFAPHVFAMLNSIVSS